MAAIGKVGRTGHLAKEDPNFIHKEEKTEKKDPFPQMLITFAQLLNLRFLEMSLIDSS